ncbi:MAG: DUF3352 domain-containing protein [Candidatus Poribacteria bacterium]
MFRQNWIQQSIKTKLEISIIFIIATLLIASTGFAQERALSEQKSLMDVTPAKPLLFVEESGISDMINTDSNFYKQIAQAPFWELLYAELETETKLKDVHLAIEPGLLILSHLFGQDVVFVMPEFKQLTEISPLFMFRLKDDDDLGKILSESIKIALSNAAQKTSEYNGYTIAHIPLPNVPFGVSCALVGNIFTIGLGDATLKKVIDLSLRSKAGSVKGSESGTVSLTQDTDFMSIMQNIPMPESSKTGQHLAVYHLNLAKVVALSNLFYAMFSRQIPDERLRPVIGMALKWLDLVPSVTATATVTDKGLVSQNYMTLNPNATAKKFLAMLQTEPGQLESMKFAPEDAIGYSGSNLIDLKRIWEMAHELITDIPEFGEQALEGLEQAQQQFGINVEEDLFSWMGNEVGVVYSDYPAVLKNNIPGKICLILKVNDSEKALQGLQKLTNLGINIAKDKDMEISIQPQEYAGETIYTVSRLPIPINPGYAIVNNFLLFSPSAEYIKKLIDCSAGRVKGISASTAFQSVKGSIPEKVNGVGFVDLGRYMEQMISSTIKSIGDEKFPSWEDADLTLDKVMMLQLTELGKLLSKALGPSVNFLLNDGTGLKSNGLLMFKDLETVVPISDPPVAKILRGVQIANEYRDAGMLDRALQYYTTVLELQPDNFEALMGTAEILQRRERFLEAQEYWSRVGFIPESAWYVIGPFGNDANAGFDTAYPPEEGVDLEGEYEGVGATVNWEQWADDKADGFVDFQYMFEPDQWVVAYAWTTVTSPETREAQLRVGSDDDVKVWLNGKEALSRKIARAASPDQDIVPVTLNEGENKLLVKVCNRKMAWGFYLRFTDSNGKPLTDVEYR